MANSCDRLQLTRFSVLPPWLTRNDACGSTTRAPQLQSARARQHSHDTSDGKATHPRSALRALAVAVRVRLVLHGHAVFAGQRQVQHLQVKHRAQHGPPRRHGARPAPAAEGATAVALYRLQMSDARSRRYALPERAPLLPLLLMARGRGCR